MSTLNLSSGGGLVVCCATATRTNAASERQSAKEDLRITVIIWAGGSRPKTRGPDAGDRNRSGKADARCHVEQRTAAPRLPAWTTAARTAICPLVSRRPSAHPVARRH